jgi:hypothetical protein
MKIYEIEVTADVTSSVTKAYPIEANSMDEAKAKAREQFEEEMEIDNSVIKVRNIEFGYTGVFKQ